MPSNTSSEKAAPLINTHKEIIYTNYSPRCPNCISAIRAAGFLAFETGDYTPKDIGHSEHRDSDQASVSTDSEVGYVPREANGNWRVDIMNKYGVGLKMERATRPISPVPPSPLSSPPERKASYGLVGSSHDSESSTRGSRTSLSSKTTTSGSVSTAGDSTIGYSTAGYGSSSSCKSPARGSEKPPTPKYTASKPAPIPTSGGSSSSLSAATSRLGSLLLAPLSSSKHNPEESLSKGEEARLKKLQEESKLRFLEQCPKRD
ncbi:uncharacterized protein LAJ45_10425 [Morchella importuna]|uniref:uncharacterized protein n=1 Tax=Morchella importuna TaxID=1174673 RepID=UPI001E8CD97E|nr:uncharacterized protein LAJ45_10425 [Morchella importuna]KAH8145624.1 hypothetical protein LAJ45_10425 [Morchella importuna]